MSFQIGTATLVEDTEVTMHYETAAWYQKVFVSAGHTAPIMVSGYSYNHNNQHPDGMPVGAVWGFDGGMVAWAGGAGIVTEAYFPSICGGLIMTSGERPERIGEVVEVHPMNPYDYAVATAVAMNGGRMGPWQITLDESLVRCERVEYDTQEWSVEESRYVPARRVYYHLVPQMRGKVPGSDRALAPQAEPESEPEPVVCDYGFCPQPATHIVSNGAEVRVMCKRHARLVAHMDNGQTIYVNARCHAEGCGWSGLVALDDDGEHDSDCPSCGAVALGSDRTPTAHDLDAPSLTTR